MLKSFLKQNLKWIPSLVVAILIFIESATPGKIIKEAGFGNEQLHISVHFLMFLILGIYVWYATKSLLRSLVLVFLYALSDEYHQSFVPARSASWFDVQVDMTGGSVGLFGIWLWNTFQKVLMTQKK